MHCSTDKSTGLIFAVVSTRITHREAIDAVCAMVRHVKFPSGGGVFSRDDAERLRLAARHIDEAIDADERERVRP